jgi:putative mRNA 3-end processing factor
VDIKIRRAGSGLIVETAKYRYAIDKASGVSADYHIISHAHSDHLPRNALGKLVASRETYELAVKKGIKMGRLVENIDNITLIDSGHILGSKAALIEDRILYTGDLNIRSRLFLEGFRPREAEILIIEATYGDPKYKFDSFNELAKSANSLIMELLRKNINVLAIGYSLGKAQILTQLLDWYNNLYVSNSVYKYNEAYRKLGVKLNSRYERWNQDVEEPFILIAHSTNKDAKDAIMRYDAIPIYFTGWAVSRSWEDRIGIGLSDHSDFYDLMRVIDRVNPSKIYTIYGQKVRFAKILRSLGYDAESI